MNDSFSAHANTHFNNPTGQNPLGGQAGNTFGQFGAPQRDNDQAPHAQTATPMAALSFGETLDLSDVDELGELLPEGIYNFQVTKADYVDYPGKANGKIPACPALKARLRLMAPTGAFNYTTVMLFFVKDNMQLKKIRDFFVSTGLVDPNVTDMAKISWPSANDFSKRYGRAKVSVHAYRDKNGNDRQSNQVDWFTQLDPDDPIPGVEMGNNTQVPF